MAAQASRQRLLKQIGRALLLRCPRCGGDRLADSWLKMRERCGSCGLALEREEEDHFLGAMMFNLIAAELACAATVAVVILVTWPSPPWRFVMYGGAATAVAAPFFFYPFSKMLWLTVDLVFRPAEGMEPGVKPD